MFIQWFVSLPDVCSITPCSCSPPASRVPELLTVFSFQQIKSLLSACQSHVCTLVRTMAHKQGLFIQRRGASETGSRLLPTTLTALQQHSPIMPRFQSAVQIGEIWYVFLCFQKTGPYNLPLPNHSWAPLPFIERQDNGTVWLMRNHWSPTTLSTDWERRKTALLVTSTRHAY